nr:hypothetical protein [Leptospira noguchii]
MEQKELSKTLFTKAFETQHNAFLLVTLGNSASASTVARQVVSQRFRCGFWTPYSLRSFGRSSLVF